MGESEATPRGVVPAFRSVPLPDRLALIALLGVAAVAVATFRDYGLVKRFTADELKPFEDQKDSIKLTSLVSNVVDKETQEKIDIVKQRMIRDFGYDEESATDVLNFVASIFARGDSKAR